MVLPVITVNVDGQMITTENKNLTIDPADSFIDYHPKIFRRLIQLRREKKLTEVDCENESFSLMKSLFLQTFPNNSMMTCLRATRTFWSFDNTLNSFNNEYNGVGINNPTYVSPGYNGAGACLQLSKALSQSVTIANPPFFNMSYTSLTVEVWIYANTLSEGFDTENPIINQFQKYEMDLDLDFVIRNRRIYLGFFNDDISGNTILKPHEWYHLSYVYDYSTLTQYVYVNGYLDGSRSSAGPYKGTTGHLVFGRRMQGSGNNYFDGCLDSISYVNRAKNEAEILRDATLVAFLSFDSSTLIDAGPLQINGIGTNYAFTSSGRVSKALTLSTSNSYVQISGLRRLGTSGWPYSISIWVHPTNATGGTIVYLSKTTSGTSDWTIPIIGFTSFGRIAINSWNGQSVSLTGPIVSLNKWTHIVATYSPTNGQRLYVNSALIASTTAFTFLAGGAPMIITLGSTMEGTGYLCAIQTGQFYGSLDEFYVYARELKQSEISTLYNHI